MPITPIFHIFPSISVQQESAKFILTLLAEELLKGPIFLLLSGGSAIAMYKEMFQLLIEKQTDLSNLTISLFDERFVLKGSTDSNEEQLRELGLLDLFQKHNAKWISYLNDTNRSGIEVAQQVCEQFKQELNENKKLIILAGVGDDGHTAGLLPTKNSLIIQEIFESKNDIEYYELSDDIINHFRQRLTATPELIKKADQIIVYATGEKKKTALERFKANNESISDCPCLALFNSKSPVVILTDQELNF